MNQNLNNEPNKSNESNNLNINQEFSEQDLQMPRLQESKEIGTVKKDTQKSPVAMLILFAVLISTIFFIPEITPYFSEILEKLNIGTNEEIYEGVNIDNKKEDEKPSEEKDNQEIYYNIENMTKAQYTDLSFENLNKIEESGIYYFSYRLKNNSKNLFDFNKNKIYIDFYDNNNTYLGRILISEDTIPSGTTINPKNIISETIYNNAKKIQILSRSERDYPEINLSNNKLTCKYSNNTLEYTFKDNKLSIISENYVYVNNLIEDEYVSYSLNYQNKLSKMNEITGVHTAFVNTTDGFTSNIEFSYEEVTDNMEVYNKYYYSKDTESKVIKYEMESVGYNCE